LDEVLGRHVEDKAEAASEADSIRAAIRGGTFEQRVAVVDEPAVLTFTAFSEIWKQRRGVQLVRPRDNEYRLRKICAFVLPGTQVRFGEKALTAITTDDIEAFRDTRKAQGVTAVTVNHDLKLLRKMFNWGIRKGYIERTPFKIGTEPAITLEKEIPRDVRFASDEDEQRLLDVANPHLRGIIIALLDTCCRKGEILSLQWKDVNLGRGEIFIEASKEKTRTARIVPISTRLRAVLDMRRHDPSGEPFGPDAYVFGNEVGERVKSVQTAWEMARDKAGLHGLHLHDLRRESGSRFDEAGVSTNYVSKLLGHTNLQTTSRYLNIQRRELHRAVEKLEQHRSRQQSVAHELHNDEKHLPAVVPPPEQAHTSKRLPS
jgi:integrase